MYGKLHLLAKLLERSRRLASVGVGSSRSRQGGNCRVCRLFSVGVVYDLEPVPLVMSQAVDRSRALANARFGDGSAAQKRRLVGF